MAYNVQTSKNGEEVDKVVVVVNQGCVGWWRTTMRLLLLAAQSSPTADGRRTRNLPLL